MQLRITREKREKQKARWIDEKYKELWNNKNLSFSVKLLKLLVTEKDRKKTLSWLRTDAKRAILKKRAWFIHKVLHYLHLVTTRVQWFIRLHS